MARPAKRKLEIRRQTRKFFRMEAKEAFIALNLIEGAEDILSEFEYLVPASNKLPGVGETGMLPALTRSDNEQKVYDALDHEERSTDQVIRTSGLPSSAVSVALLGLEMKRLVKQLPQKLFLRNQ